MRYAVRALSVAAVLGIALTGLTTGDSLSAGEEAVIKQRIDLMRSDILKNWKPIKAYAKKGTGSPADVAKYAANMETAAKKIATMFPKGTGRGDYPDTVTRALPTIWKDWKGFEKAAQTLADESQQLAKVASGGDAEAIRKQIGATGKLGCGGCHKPFRGAKVKK